jgi:dipeptidyl aminopeptidase/acylaminoacyl peptidase
MVATARYGYWASPLAASDVARAKVSLSDLCSDGRALFWLESRPTEAGRVVMVRCTGGGPPADHSPPGVSIRSRVHEYGGGAICLVPGHADGAFAYVDQADQRVWYCDGPAAEGPPGAAVPRPLTPGPLQGTELRHGGLGATADGDWVLAVRETHQEGVAQPARCVVALPTRDGASKATLLEGHDFYGAPRVDGTGARLAVVVWDHPDMPWDASVLVVVPLVRTDQGAAGDDGATLTVAGPPVTVAGGPAESVGQPTWQHDGSLRFVSDRGGWWQPYVHVGPFDGGAPGTEPVALSAEAAEFHGPDWVLGQTTMAQRPDRSLVARRTAAGLDSLVLFGRPEAVGAGTGTGDTRPPTPLPQPCVSVSAVCAHGDAVALIGSSPDAPTNVWLLAPDQTARPLRPPAAGATALDPGDVAVAEPFSLDGRSGRAIFGTLYRPNLSATQGPPKEAPPLVVWCHGGPTSSCQAGLDLTLQFFTTRGFAVACVDYAGSSGYGRDYRDALWGQWGVADAEDCLDAALHLAGRGDVDARRLAIRGGSAGGMTALNALASGEGFGACASWYGVTDLLGLVATTHDFEAHYTDRLIGPLPEARALYVERSPVALAAAMAGSVLLLQGTDDAVVPPEQAERMRAALESAGRPCDLRFFEGEGHGFRRADTLTACLEAELGFYLEELRL